MSEYNAVSWSSLDDITLPKLQQMSANDQYLKDKVPDITYTRSTMTVNSGIKMVCGRVVAAAGTGTHRSANINWAGQFSQGCYPIVVNGIMSMYERYATITCAGSNTLAPDSQGMLLVIYIDPKNRGVQDKIDHTMYADWLAIGY